MHLCTNPSFHAPFHAPTPAISPKMSPHHLCCKCKAEPSTVDIKFALYCRSCFLEACFSKYRTALSKITASSAKCLVFVPDTDAGRLLLHFTQLPRILEPRRQNVLECEVAVMQAEAAEAVKASYPNVLAVHLLSDATVESDAKSDDTATTTAAKSDDNTTANTANTTTTTANTTTITLLHSLIKLAKERNLTALLLPQTSTATAASILASVCKGRGEWIRWDGAAMKECDGIRVGSPLRDISEREVQLYTAQLCGQYLFGPGRSGEDGRCRVPETIDELAQAFLGRLDEENPGTANVVLRTIDKIDSVASVFSPATGGQACKGCFVPAGVDYCYSCARERELNK